MSPAESDISNRRRADEAWLLLSGGAGDRRPAVPPPCDIETDVQQIEVLNEGIAGHAPTTLIALDLDDALVIFDRLNRRLGCDREAWTAMVAASMHAEDEDPESDPWH